MTDNPFAKGAYGDYKSKRNFQEVAACLVAARQLGIPVEVIDGAGHNLWLEVSRSFSGMPVVEAQARVIERARRLDPAVVEKEAAELWSAFEENAAAIASQAACIDALYGPDGPYGE